MSHAVTVTRTTTTVTTTSAILLNTGYLKTLPGILKLVQVVLGCIVVGLVANYFSFNQGFLFVPELFLLLIATTCLITTSCLLLSCLLSISTATIIAKTMFVTILHLPESVLYLCSSFNYLVAIISRNVGESVAEYGYADKVFAGMLSIADKNGVKVIGVINTILYLASTFFAFRYYRRG